MKKKNAAQAQSAIEGVSTIAVVAWTALFVGLIMNEFSLLWSLGIATVIIAVPMGWFISKTENNIVDFDKD